MSAPSNARSPIARSSAASFVRPTASRIFPTILPTILPKILPILALALASLSSACMGTTQRREDDLKRHALTFNDDWRWARWDSMAGSMSAEEATGFLSRAQTLEPELVVADFEVTSINFLEQSKRANVVAKFEWYMKRDARIKRTTVEQLWENREGRWLVIKIRRTRGDRFGLVIEPEPTPAPPAP